jgi:transposase
VIGLPPSVRVYLATDPVSMHKSFDGLTGLVRDHLGYEPLSGHLFVFRNRIGTRVKLLYWDRTGLCLWYKHLQKGTFRFPEITGSSAEITAGDLMLILEGVDLAGARRRKRFSDTGRLGGD